MEIMLVLGIVGILASALYPNIKWYLDRAHDVEIKGLMKDWISIVNSYTQDKGELQSQPNQASDPNEAYCVESATDCFTWDPSLHIALDQYIKNTPEWRRLIERRDKYCEKLPAFPYCSEKIWWLFRESPNSIFTQWWYILPGKNPLDTGKKWELYYYLDNKANYYDDSVPMLTISGSNMPIDAMKRCSPWVSTSIHSAWADSYTECLYIFEE